MQGGRVFAPSACCWRPMEAFLSYRHCWTHCHGSGACVCSPGQTAWALGRLPRALPSDLPLCSPTLTPFPCYEQPPRALLADLCPGSHGTHGIFPASASSPPCCPAQPSPSVPWLGSLGPSPSALTSGVWPGPALHPSSTSGGWWPEPQSHPHPLSGGFSSAEPHPRHQFIFAQNLRR